MWDKYCFIRFIGESMKIYFYKENLRCYQTVSPINPERFIEKDVDDFSIVNEKQLTEFNGEYIFVEPQPDFTTLYKWNGQKWIIDTDKLNTIRAEQQAQVWEKIKEYRYQNGLGGVYIERVGKWFQTGEEEKTKYLGLDKVIDKIGEIDWKCYDNSFIKMNRTLLNEIFLAMVVTENADHINAEKHRMAMMQSENPLEYDFSTGWSAVYREA